MYSIENILEHGQSDFRAVLNDYRLACLSWQHFISASGGLDNPQAEILASVNAAKIAHPYDYILNVLLDDVLMAISRIADQNSKRGVSDKLHLLKLSAHLTCKRNWVCDEQLASRLDAARSSISAFRNDDRIKRIRDRRDSVIAHRLDGPPKSILYGELQDIISQLKKLFCELAPLFRATAGFPDSPVEQLRSSTSKFWECFEIGAKHVAQVN